MKLLLSTPEGFQSEVIRASQPFNDCVDEHIAIYNSTSVPAELAARTTVAECAQTRWQPIIELLNRASSTGVEVDGRKVRDAILDTGHRRIVLALEKNST